MSESLFKLSKKHLLAGFNIFYLIKKKRGIWESNYLRLIPKKLFLKKPKK